MITDPNNPLAIVLDAEGKETGNILPYRPTLDAIRLAFEYDGYALEINGDGTPLCDFRRLPGRVWTSQHGQEIRVFQSDDGLWQYAFGGMDISDGACYDSEADAREHAEAVDANTPGLWSDDPGDGGYPRWADLFAGLSRARCSECCVEIVAPAHEGMPVWTATDGSNTCPSGVGHMPEDI